MKLYWVSAIIQNRFDTRPWLCAMSQGELSLDKAMEVVVNTKESNNVLSVWVDMIDENNVKQTVFHECYIDGLGYRTDI